MINTLSISRELTKSGLKREHAEAIADAVAEAIAQQNGNFATTEFVHTRISEMQKGTDDKIDTLRVEVSELRNDMETKIGEVRVEIASVRVEISELRADMSTLNAKISASETRIVRWVVGIVIAMGIFQALFDFIPSLISGPV